MSKIKQFFEKLAVKLTKNNHRGTRRAVFSAFALMIALCTVYALVLPAITATANVYPLNEDTDVTGVSLSYNSNGRWLTVGKNTTELELGVNTELRFILDYRLPIGTLSSQCDTITYHLPSFFNRVTEVSDIVINSDGEIIGTFTISEDGEVVITFNDDFGTITSNASTAVVGKFSFNCTVGDVLGGGDGRTITIGEWSIDLNTGGGGGGDTSQPETSTSETEPPPPENEDITVNKTHTVVDPVNGIVDFTAVFSSDKATDTPPLIFDHMASGLVYVDETFQINEVTLNSNGEIATVGAVVPGTTFVNGAETLVPGNTDFYFQFTNPMTKDTVYAIRYRAKVVDPFSGSYHTNNQIKVTTQIENKKAEAGFKDDVWLSNPNTVTKSATISGGYITWTITVHRHNGYSLQGWVLSDILEGYDFTGPASLSIGGVSAGDVSFPYTITSNDTTETNYVFTYTTPYEPKIGQTGVSNQAVFRPSDYTGDKPIVITKDIGLDENNPLSKEDVSLRIDSSDVNHPLAIVDWEVDITPTLSDLYGGDGYDWLYDDTLHDGQYLTPEQAAALDAAIVAEMTTKLDLERGVPNPDPNATYNPAIQKDYTFEVKRSDSADLPAGCYDRFTLHAYVDLDKDTNQFVHFAYSSTGPSGDLKVEHSYENRGKVMQNAPGNHVYTVESWESAHYRPAILKTDPIPPTGTSKASANELTTHDYYEVEGQLEWNLTVAIPDGIVTPVTVEDTLPEGVSFDSVVFSVDKKNYSTYNVVWDDDSTKLSGTITLGSNSDKEIAVTRSGQTLTMVFNEEAVAQYAGSTQLLEFRVVTDINQLPSYEDGEDPPTFENNASVKIPTATPDVMQTLGTAKQTQEVTVDKYHGVLTKTVEQSDGDKRTGKIPYHIEINPDALDLLEGTDTLILSDHLSAFCQVQGDVSISLNPDSLKLYNMDTTKPGNKGTLIGMEEYRYSYSSNYDKQHLLNDLIIHIPDERAIVIEYTYVVSTMGSFDSAVSNKVKLEGIVESEVTSGKTINVKFTSSGAVAGLDGITIYKVDDKNYNLTLPNARFDLYEYDGSNYVFDREIETGENGTAQLSELDMGYAYKLVETQAPENYLLDTEPYYFMIAGASTSVKPSDFAGDMLQMGESIYRPNTSSYVSVKVEKHWQDASGSEVSHDGTIQFELYRKAGTRDPHVTLTASIIKQVKNKDPVTLPFTPQTFMRGDTVEFVVTETRSRPKQYSPPTVTFYVNGIPRVVTPYWDPAQDAVDNATVTYTVTFRIEEDTFISGDLGELTNDPTIVARVSGEPLPTETTASTETTAKTYAVRFTSGRGSALVNGQPLGDTRVVAGTVVTLVPPTDAQIPSGQQFSGWQVNDGNGHDITSTALSGNTLTMPASSVTITALFTEIPVTKYTLYNYDPTGPTSTQIGSYAAGATVTLSVNDSEIPSGFKFNQWIVYDGTNGAIITNPDFTFSDVHSRNATFAMPEHDVYVKAEIVAKTPHSISVHDGTYTVTTASTGGIGTALEGDVVTLNATIPTNKLFDKWVITSPSTGLTLSDIKDPHATFTMPDADVAITATFRDKPNNLIMNGDFENVEGTITSSTNGFEWTGVQGSAWSVVDGVLTYTYDYNTNSNLVAKIDPTYNNGNGLKANQTYTLFADVDTNKANEFCVQVKNGSNTVQSISTVDGRVTFTTDSNPSAYTIIVKVTRNSGSTAEFSVDNVILVEGDVETPPSGETTYDVNVTQPTSGGTISASPAKAAENAPVTLTPSPAPGYELDHWVVTDSNSTAITVTGNTFTMPAGEVNVTAVFKKSDYTATIVNGTVSGGTTADIQIGDTITLTANTPADGKEFYRWVLKDTSVGSGTITAPSESSTTFTLTSPGNVTLEAEYRDVTYAISFDPTGCGTAMVDNTAVTRACMGDEVTLTPTNVPSGKVFDHWTVVESISGDTVTVSGDTFTMPDAAVTVTAHYTDAPVGDTVTLTVNGTYLWKKDNPAKPITVLPSSTMTFAAGETATIVVTYPDVYNIKMADYQSCLVATVSDGSTLTPVITQSEVVDHDSHAIYTYTVTMDADKTVTLTSTQVDFKEPTATISGGTSGGDTSTPDTSTPESSTPESSTPATTNAWENTVDRVTLTFYDKDCTQYGITYHSYKQLTDPVIQYVQGGTPASWDGASTVTPTLTANSASGTMMKNYDPATHTFTAGETTSQTDYAYKAALPSTLTNNTAYTYRVGGKIGGVEVWSEPYTFTTNTSSSSTPDMSFIWFSDSQFGDSDGAIMASKMGSILNAGSDLLSDDVDMILSGGDFTDHGDLFYYAAAQIGGNEDFFARYPLFVASGNHDRKGTSHVASNIVNVNVGDSGGAHSGTGDYYSFDYNGVHVIVLNNGDESNELSYEANKTMVDWLEDDLIANAANTDTKWTLVMMHKPVFTCIKNSETVAGYSGTSSKSRSALVPLFNQYGVDVVMQAHVHMYSRTKSIADTSGTVTSGYTTANETNNGFTYEMAQNPGDPIYTVIGAAGPDSLGGWQRVPAEVQPDCIAHAESMQSNSFAAWRIEGDKLYVDACYLDSSGNVHYYEHFGIDKSGTPTPPTPTTYGIDVSDDTHGTVTAKVGGTEVSEAAANATVTLTIEPDTGYELDTLTVDGDNVTASVSNGTYTFTMPSHAVEISATFKESGGSGGGGTNLVTNGDFSDGTNGWSSRATSFDASDGTAHVTAGNEDPKGISQTIEGLTVGNTYQVSFDVISGSPNFFLNGGSAQATSTGHFSTTFEATSTTATLLFSGYNKTFVIDNVSLVDTSGGGGGGGGGDDPPTPSGNNLVTNGDFSTGDFTGWTKGGTVAISNGQCDIFQSNSKLQQTIAVTSGKTYELSFDVISDGGKATYGEVMQGGSSTAIKVINQVVPSHPTKVSGQFEATADSVTIQIRPASGGSASLVVDNVSLVEVPSTDASPMYDAAPFEDTGPGDDDLPSLDLDGARSSLLGDSAGGTLVDTYTITASNSWELVIDNLLSEEIIDDELVYYVYYVREVNPPDDTALVQYVNNDGINSGTIGITNTVSEEEREHIILPETGGGGNWPYVVGGVTLMTVCLFGGVVMTRRRRKASG